MPAAKSLQAGNLIARYSINILGTDSYSADSVTAVVKTQSAAKVAWGMLKKTSNDCTALRACSKVTEELMRHLTVERSGGNVQAIGLSMRTLTQADSSLVQRDRLARMATWSMSTRTCSGVELPFE